MKGKKKNGYVSPEIEILCFADEDIITTSGQEQNPPGPDSSDTDYEGGIDW